jgi:hypothetical protein
VRLCGEVDNSVSAFSESGEHGLAVGDVAAHEAVAARVYAFEVVRIACVSERVKVCNLRRRVVSEDEPDEGGADKARAARDK